MDSRSPALCVKSALPRTHPEPETISLESGLVANRMLAKFFGPTILGLRAIFHPDQWIFSDSSEYSDRGHKPDNPSDILPQPTSSSPKLTSGLTVVTTGMGATNGKTRSLPQASSTHSTSRPR